MDGFDLVVDANYATFGDVGAETAPMHAMRSDCDSFPDYVSMLSAAAAVAPKLRALHPDWTISDRAAAAEVRYMDQELAGTKHRPVPQPD